MGNEAYQERDAAFFDYKLFERFDFWLRGPEWPLDDPAEFNIVGSARVFGRFVDKTLTDALSEEHGIRAHNLGTAGGNPYMYLRHPALIEYLSTAKGVPIFQVCGADGHSNDWFRRITGRTMKVRKEGLGAKVGSNVRGGVSYRSAFKRLPFDEVVEQIRKGQDFVLEDYRQLKEALGRPAVIMYFSDRPARPLNKRTYRDLFKFPHCVDERMWNDLKSIFEYSLEIVCNDGMPYEVSDGETNVKVDLYPSPEMHRRAAAEIARHRAAITALADAPPMAMTRPAARPEPEDDEPAPAPRRARRTAGSETSATPAPVPASGAAAEAEAAGRRTTEERRAWAAEQRRQKGAPVRRTVRNA